MGIQISVRNRAENIPGVYTRVNFRNSPVIAVSGFGSTALIDTGSNKGFGGLSGIRGMNAKNKKALYRFGSYGDFVDYVNGGALLSIADKLFNPGGGNAGVSSLLFARACSTVPASYEFESSTGSFTIETKDEGLYPNAIYQGVNTPTTALTVAADSTDFGTGKIETGGTLTFSITIGSTVYNLLSRTLTGDYTTSTDEEVLRDRLYEEIVSGLDDIGLSVLSGKTETVVSNVVTQITGNLSAPATAVLGIAGKPVTVAYTNDAGTSPTLTTGAVSIAAFSSTLDVEGTIEENLSTGYAIEGEIEDGLITLSFYKGTYAGTDEAISYFSDGQEVAEVNGIVRAQATPVKLVESIPFKTIRAFQEWALQDPTFKDYFLLKSVNITATPDNEELDTETSSGADYDKFNGVFPFLGGTETYASSHLNDVFTAMEGEDVDFIMLDTKDSAKNDLLSSAVVTRFKDFPTVYVAGGDDEDEFEAIATGVNAGQGSIEAAVNYGTSIVKVVHSGVTAPTTGAAGGIKSYTSLYHTAIVCGIDAGREPQQGLTFQRIPSITGLIHNPTADDERRGINKGVFMVRQEPDGFYAADDVNTSQVNRAVYANNSSYLAQLRKIKRALEKELITILRNRFQKGVVASNRNTVNEAAVVSAGASYLSSRVATLSRDSYLVSFNSPRAERIGVIVAFRANVVLNTPTHFVTVELDVNA